MLILVITALLGLATANTTPRTTTAPPTWYETRTTKRTTMRPHYTGIHSTHKPFHHTTLHHGHHHTTLHHGHQHTTQPPMANSNEFDTATFYYDALSHTMVMHLGTCYLMKLSSTQQHLVHTQHGLKTIEYMLMRSVINGQRTTLTHEQVVSMSVHLSHMCPAKNNFLVHGGFHHTTTTRP
ncbi:uncharacterized protein [Argopecten irradians]|uniref:uncharacterized protein isoform X2 n=1 Tax=Argopecten irradians TaxID=31199 RepID=UPI003715A09C